MAPRLRFSVVSMMALCIAAPAIAQAPAAPPPTPQPTEQRSTPRETVVVTANRREEDVQDIAVAITAVTSKAKEEFGIVTVTDLTNITPGLAYTASNERITLRGIGRLTNNFGADPGVANYHDGIYTAFATLAGKDAILIDRVEVLRGPQGTLYGRNAIGGAINTVSKRPSRTFQTEARLGYGNYDAIKVAVAVSGPITDWLRYRVAGWREDREGVNPNFGAGTSEGWEFDQDYLEAQLEGEVGDVTFWAKVVDISHDYSGPPGGRVSTFSAAPYLTYLPGAAAQAGAAARTGFADGGLSPLSSFAFTGNPDILSYTQDGAYTQNPFANGIRAYNSSRELTTRLPKYDEFVFEGIYSTRAMDIKYSTGYVFYDYQLDTDVDATPARAITYNALGAKIPGAACPAVPTLNGFPVNTVSLATAACHAQSQKTIQPATTNLYKESRSFFSHELNVISAGEGPLQWIAGLYGYQDNSDQPSETKLLDAPAADLAQEARSVTASAPYVSAGGVAVGSIRPNPGRRRDYTRNVGLQFAYGLYGQGDLEINDAWTASLGLRYSYDLKTFTESAQYLCYIICASTFQTGAAANGDVLDITGSSLTGIAFQPGAAAPEWQPGVQNATAANFYSGVSRTADGVAHRTLRNDWSAITGAASIAFSPIEDTLLFVKYSRGYKAGGFNANAMSLRPQTNKETVDSYEGGWKQEWGDLDLTTNLAAFLYKYHDAQAPLTVVTSPGVAGGATYTAFINLPDVQTTGVELETTWKPVERLRIGFTYAYLNAEITKSGVYRDPTRIAGDGLRDRSVAGNTLPNAPRHKVSVNASYLFEFKDGASLMPTVSWHWRDSFAASIFNNPYEVTPDFAQTDARLLWNDASRDFTVIGWVRNLFDEEGYEFVSSTLRTGDSTAYQNISFTPPRMFGIELQFHWK